MPNGISIISPRLPRPRPYGVEERTATRVSCPECGWFDGGHSSFCTTLARNGVDVLEHRAADSADDKPRIEYTSGGYVIGIR